MQWLELNNVEYGECCVLGGKNSSILMVDCGSMNTKLRSPEMDLGDVFTFIRERYKSMSEKHFLLTHYHRDHLCGLWHILRESPAYFDRVYIPYLPKDRLGGAPLLDFAIFAYVFLVPQTDCAQVNTACLSIFKKLSDTVGEDRIFTLKDGDEFLFDNVNYQVLSPREEGFPFGDLFLTAVEEMNVALSNPFSKGCEAEFMRVKEQFTSVYYRCLLAFSAENRESPQRRLNLLEALDSSFSNLENLKAQINLSPAAPEIRRVLGGQAVREAYGEAANAASVIFHNRRKTEASYDDILMTGDATGDVITELYDRLYGGYFILKAPHHGTPSGYSSIFKDMGADHVLISSGDYHAGGEIAPEYSAMECVKHCTNPGKCKWAETSGGCCNRLNYCYDQREGAGLTIKCPATKFSGERPDCGIYVVAPQGGRACFCDVNLMTDSRI